MDDGMDSSVANTTDSYPSPSREYLLMSMISLLVACAAAYWASVQPAESPTYFFAVLIAAVSAALLLFGILKSTATLTGPILGLKLQAGGPAALAIAVLLIGMVYKPVPPAPLGEFTVKLRWVGDGPPNFQGTTVVLDLGPEDKAFAPSPMGSFSVSHVPTEVTKQPIGFEIRSSTIGLADGQSSFVVPSDRVVRIKVGPVRSGPLEPVLIKGERIMLQDGFRSFSDSGYSFPLRRIVSWGDMNVDIGFAMQEARPSFFIPFDEEPYSTKDGASGGLALAPIQSLTGVHDCASIKEWKHHIVEVLDKTVYCLKLRYGKNFAKLFVGLDSGNDPTRGASIHFDWVMSGVE